MANDNACLSERETFIASGCLQCAGNEESCCAESYVPLTIADIDAILELGHTLEEATQAGEYYEEYLDDAEPWWRASMTEIEGRLFRVTTRKNERAQCVFLREGEGCLLGANRPRVCKIYPFWVDESGAIIVEPGEEECCNIAAGAVPVERGIRMIDESPESILEYYREIRRDCEENGARHRELLVRLLEKTGVGAV
ncbi:MAG: YkgJ family cysteine cluster protein [Spirochaetota bacterium]